MSIAAVIAALLLLVYLADRLSCSLQRKLASHFLPHTLMCWDYTHVPPLLAQPTVSTVDNACPDSLSMFLSTDFGILK